MLFDIVVRGLEGSFMSPYFCFLVSVIHNGGLLKCAIKIHGDCLSGDAPEYVYEPENKIQFFNHLPAHVKSCGEIVEIVQIFEVCEINPPSEDKNKESQQTITNKKSQKLLSAEIIVSHLKECEHLDDAIMLFSEGNF